MSPTPLRFRAAGDRIRVHVTDQEPLPAYEVGRQLFRSAGEPLATAIYATSDTIAIGLMGAAWEAGIGVPEQVSIVGFDDIDMAAFTTPPLTTISQAGVEMGRIAATLALRMIEENLDGEAVADVVLPPSLVVRRSTRPLAEGAAG